MLSCARHVPLHSEFACLVHVVLVLLLLRLLTSVPGSATTQSTHFKLSVCAPAAPWEAILLLHLADAESSLAVPVPVPSSDADHKCCAREGPSWRTD